METEGEASAIGAGAADEFVVSLSLSLFVGSRCADREIMDRVNWALGSGLLGRTSKIRIRKKNV